MFSYMVTRPLSWAFSASSFCCVACLICPSTCLSSVSLAIHALFGALDQAFPKCRAHVHGCRAPDGAAAVARGWRVRRRSAAPRLPSGSRYRSAVAPAWHPCPAATVHCRRQPRFGRIVSSWLGLHRTGDVRIVDCGELRRNGRNDRRRCRHRSRAAAVGKVEHLLRPGRVRSGRRGSIRHWMDDRDIAVGLRRIVAREKSGTVQCDIGDLERQTGKRSRSARSE